MKHLAFFLFLSALSLFSTAQKADFKAAEKFRADNLIPSDMLMVMIFLISTG